VLVFHLFVGLVAGKWGVGRESWGSLSSNLKKFGFFLVGFEGFRVWIGGL